MTRQRKSSSARGKNEPPEKAANSPAKRPICCDVEISSAFKRAARKHREEDRELAAEAITRVRSHFGKPHLHAGIGVRALGGELYECRVGLHLRLVFARDTSTKPPTLYFDMIGNHDDVKRYLKRK